MIEPTRQVLAMLARPARTIAAFAAALCLAAFVGNAPATAQTLTEALSYSYNNNPQLLAQRALLRATDEQVPQALSGWRPTVAFTGEAGTNRSGFNEPGAVECTGKQPGQTCLSSYQTRELNLAITQ
jgi:outer membrane protein TolC